MSLLFHSYRCVPVLDFHQIPFSGAYVNVATPPRAPAAYRRDKAPVNRLLHRWRICKELLVLRNLRMGKTQSPRDRTEGDSRVEQGWAKDEERSEALVGLVNDADGVEVEARRAPREVRVVANVPKGIDRAAIADNVDDADVGDAL